MVALTVVTGVPEEAEVANSNIEAPGAIDLVRAAAEKTDLDPLATSTVAEAGPVKGQSRLMTADTIGHPEEVGETEKIARTDEIETAVTGNVRASGENVQDRHGKRTPRVRPNRRRLSLLKMSEIGAPSSSSS